jgi:hypothetical protein
LALMTLAMEIIGARYPQSNGKINFSFGSIPYEGGDTLTFSVLAYRKKWNNHQ